MKRLPHTLAMLVLATLGAPAADDVRGPDSPTAEHPMTTDTVWLTDMEQAKTVAAREGKLILIDFTGSDWCGWCVKLKKEVFTREEFLEGAGKDFVLVEIDFPKEADQSDEQKEANKALAKRHQVRGFPTIVLTDASGREFARTGYREGGPGPYLEHLRQLRDRRDLE